MVRRIASQVHKQVARLMRGKVIEAQPAWYSAVLEHPPLPLPAKAPAARTAFDLDVRSQPSSSSGGRKAKQMRPLPIYYVEDDIRRQFFRDHPFEAFRPRTLTEGGQIEAENPIKGVEWTRLRQRGRNPSPEDCIQFALNLHQHHDVVLSHAYARAVAQFRALRSERHIAATFAMTEAEFYGNVEFKSEITRGFRKEIRNLGTFERQTQLDEGALAARKRWRAIVHDHKGEREWSKGEKYVRLWREGVRPDYAPALTDEVAPARTEFPVNLVEAGTPAPAPSSVQPLPHLLFKA